MAVLDKSLELQIRRLKFAGDLEARYRENAGRETLFRFRVVTGIFALIFSSMQLVERGTGTVASGADRVGPLIAAIGEAVVVGVVPWALLGLSFYRPFVKHALSSLAIYLLLAQVWFGAVNIGDTRGPLGVDVAHLVVTMIHLTGAIFIVAAIRAPAWVSALYCVGTWTLTTFIFVYSGADLNSPGSFAAMLFFLVSVLMLILGAYFNEMGDRRSFVYRELLAGERDRLEQVLQNVLPASIAERLKHSRDVIAEYHPSVTVLFADVVDFTPFAASRGPGEVVGFLNEVFSRFDALVEQKGLEKIKTVGDAYMVAAGLPTPMANHLQAMADLALEMRGVASALGVKMRIGMHTGPVIAGVIGTKKYLYDLWGDTVNTASRMESHSLPGEIQMAASTAEALGEEYELSERGEIDVKGVGRVTTYLLTRRKAPSVVVESRA